MSPKSTEMCAIALLDLPWQWLIDEAKPRDKQRVEA